MQTLFTPEQRRRDVIREADSILRTCVHCGFCTATCPTYVLLGNELDSPRGRIYLVKDMMEADKPATDNVVRHLDRCLSCLSCMTTCPSGVDYMHLIDRARAHIHRTYRRPLAERFLRALLAWVLVRPRVFRAALRGARFIRPMRDFLPGRLKGMVEMAPSSLPRPSPTDKPAVHGSRDPASGRARRIALLPGCAQQVLAPRINAAAVRLLTRLGHEVVVAQGVGCCGALVHHMGREDDARRQAGANIAAWVREMDGAGLEAIVVTASGCGTTLKDYGHLLKDDPQHADAAARVSALARDISEVVGGEDISSALTPDDERAHVVVGYHGPCSMQHGQNLKTQPQNLLRLAGFEVREPTEAHLCCGSAGTYNLLQPDIAARLGERKGANLEKIAPRVIATGNIGCMVQIARHTEIPVVHTLELLDWATGGPKPDPLK